MLKALIKKNFQEVGTYYFRDKRNNKQVKGKGRKGMIILLAVLFVMMAASFAALAALFFTTAIEAGVVWFGWTMNALIGVLMAVLINAFISYAQLYMSRDNELLLSMPIPPSTILMSRMVSVYIMGLVYFAMVWPPAIIVYNVMVGWSFAGVMLPLLLFFFIGLIVLAFTCIIGWIIAELMRRFNGKKLMTVAAAVIFTGAIVFFQIKSNAIFTALAKNPLKYSNIISHKLPLMTIIGKASAGDSMSFVLVLAIAILLMGAIYYIMSKTFIRIATSKRTAKKAVYQEKTAKQTPILKALMRKEALRFTGSVNYMMNCGMGILMLAALVIFVFIKKATVLKALSTIGDASPVLELAVPVLIAIAIATVASMIDVSAPSVSLEGKTIWQLQSLPVDPYDVLRAKWQFCYKLQGTSSVLAAVCVCTILQLEVRDFLAVLVFCVAFSLFSSTIGVVLNLKRPNLGWTSEVVPIKQSAAVAFVLFGGWLAAAITCGLFFLVYKFIPAYIYLLIWTAILYGLYIYADKWLRTKGARIFANL